MLSKPSQYSLADFFAGDSQNPLIPPEDFTAWRQAADPAFSIYEPKVHGAALPRVQLDIDGKLRSVINFSSYNYLGLSTHPAMIAAAQNALLEYGTGTCGSPVLGGMTDLHAKFEAEMTHFVGAESTIVYTSG